MKLRTTGQVYIGLAPYYLFILFSHKKKKFNNEKMNGKSGSVFTVRLPTNARFYYPLCYTQIIIPSGAIFFNLSAFNFPKGTNIFIFKTIKQNIERKKKPQMDSSF